MRKNIYAENLIARKLSQLIMTVQETSKVLLEMAPNPVLQDVYLSF